VAVEHAVRGVQYFPASTALRAGRLRWPHRQLPHILAPRPTPAGRML